MTSATHSWRKSALRSAQRTLRVLKELIRRGYAVVIIGVVVWLSYRAFAYLIVSLLWPAAVPPQIEQLPLRLTEDVLRTGPESWSGLRATGNPRMPPAHYHQVDGWFQPDPHNDCTRRGCHAPMPHNRRKEVRAFLNLHATSLHCGVCHLQAGETPTLPLTWYDLSAGTTTEPPALLETYGWIMSAEGQRTLSQPTPEVQARLVQLLRAAAAQSHGDPDLARLAELVAAPRPTSTQFQVAVAEVQARLPLHLRGEYGARLALRDVRTGEPILGHPGTAAAVREFLERAENDAGPGGPALRERAALLEKVHPLRRPQTLQCSDCHRAPGAPGLVDLRAVGYPPERIAALHQSWVFTAIEHIAAGRPLYLPGFVRPEE